MKWLATALLSISLLTFVSCVPPESPKPTGKPPPKPAPKGTVEKQATPAARDTRESPDAPSVDSSVEALIGPPNFRELFDAPLSAPGLLDTAVRKSSGKLPAKWQIRPLWEQAAYQAVYSRIEGDNPEGTAAFRIELNGLRQAFHDLIVPVRLPANRFTRLAVYLRSSATAQITLVLFEENSSGAPGKELWKQRRIGVPAEWQEQVFVIPPQSGAASMLLGIRMEQDGTLDLDNLRVWSLEGEKLNLGLEVPDGNALDRTSFPAGLPGGWSVRSAQAQADPKQTGPSGLPALKITPAGRGQLISAPLRLPGERTYYISFDAKGTRPNQQLEIRFGPPEQQVSRQVVIGEEWRRFSVQLKPGYPINGIMVLRIFASAPYWLDQLQVAADDTEFKPGRTLELTLRTDRPYALFDDSEPDPTVQLVLHGVRGPGVRVELQTEDPNGRISRLPALSVPEGHGMWSATVTPDVNQETPFGSFRLEARAVDARGEALSAWSELLFHRVRRARYRDAFAPDSPFGIHILAEREQAEMAKKLGFNWMRVHDGANAITKWYFLEQKTNVLDFTQADRSVEILRDARLMILGLLDTAPTWRSYWHEATRSGSYYQDALWVPKDLEMWEEYAQRTVAHFRGRIDHWEIWNEPYIGMFFNREYNPQARQKRQGTADDYVPLLQRAHRAAKRANPEALILLSTGSSSINNIMWHERLLQLGAEQHADGMTYHLYTTRMLGGPDDAIADLTRKYRGNHRLGNGPLWNTEGGPGATFNHPYRHVPPHGYADASHINADHAVRYFVSALGNRTDKFFLYTFHGWGDWTRQWSVMNQDGTLPHLATALANLFWHLEDSRFERWEALPDRGGWKAIFSRADGKTVEVFLPDQPLKALEGAVDLYGNPWRPESPHTGRPAIRVR